MVRDGSENGDGIVDCEGGVEVEEEVGDAGWHFFRGEGCGKSGKNTKGATI